MINNTDSLYPKVTSFKHPKPGQTNSAVKVGVVPVAGGYPVWVRTPGNPSDTYIARLEWAGNSREVVLQHLNRLQNTLTVLVGDAATGEVRTVFTDTDDNVHFQGFERLVNELVANNKDFTMMAYPNRSHGISEGKGTTLHLYTMLTRFLNENLPPGPRTR